VYNAGKAILLPTSGKQFANVPKNMLAANIGYDDGRFYGTFGGKYTSKLYGDLTNDEAISGRTVFNAGAGIYLPVDKKVVKDATSAPERRQPVRQEVPGRRVHHQDQRGQLQRFPRRRPGLHRWPGTHRDGVPGSQFLTAR
jgi:hypothetical protein